MIKKTIKSVGKFFEDQRIKQEKRMKTKLVTEKLDRAVMRQDAKSSRRELKELKSFERDKSAVAQLKSYKQKQKTQKFDSIFGGSTKTTKKKSTKKKQDPYRW